MQLNVYVGIKFYMDDSDMTWTNEMSKMSIINTWANGNIPLYKIC
jgi:hypothetical protein